MEYMYLVIDKSINIISHTIGRKCVKEGRSVVIDALTNLESRGYYVGTGPSGKSRRVMQNPGFSRPHALST